MGVFAWWVAWLCYVVCVFSRWVSFGLLFTLVSVCFFEIL